jgi:hypothetical protein
MRQPGGKTVGRGAGIVGAVLALAALSVPAGGQGVSGQEAVFKGQASGWFSLNTGSPSTPNFGLRYIPSLSLGSVDEQGNRLDAEFSANAFLTGSAPGWTDLETREKIRAYRTWVRLSSSHYELRAGLQKINFGSASIFRPLMWFDRVDARDPLQITPGIWGLLGRYYFANNANIWLWGLMGNTGLKGWETSPTKKASLEAGARVESPLFKGEFGLTYHRRTADLGDSPVPPGPEGNVFVPEDRFGIDGKWDLGVGLWFEASLLHQDHAAIAFPFQRSFTVGGDYTFGLGNGLTALFEHFELANAEKPLGGGDGLRISALSLRYPAGLLDNLSAFVYYDWKARQFFRYLSWQRTYDDWQFLLIGFWNPEESPFLGTGEGSNQFAGAGVQLMVVFNH